jgi:hypothetical protein
VVHNKKISTYIFAPIVILAFYSFGVFGFFNLFGLAYLIKIIVLLFCILGAIAIFEIQVMARYKVLSLLIILFFLYYGFMYTIITGNILNGVVNGIAMAIIALYLLGISEKRLKFTAKGIFVITGIFSILGSIVFICYFFDMSLLNPKSIGIFQSESGNSTVIAQSLFDYFSFTSGATYSFFGYEFIRLNGYCSEPSSTIVHYLAPASLAFYYNYNKVGIYIVLFSLLCISSLTGVLIIIGSFIMYVLLAFKRDILKKILIVFGSGFLIIFMMNVNAALSSVLDIGDIINDSFSYDLVSQKRTSAIVRLGSYSEGVNTFLQKPLGGTYSSTPTALWLKISMVGGIFLLFIFILFSLKIVHLVIFIYDTTLSKYKKYGVSLFLTTYLGAFNISSYGWDRIPGVIFFILFYSILMTQYKKLVPNKGIYIKNYS